jgi:uncharacterized heparinase superfamily protein
MPRVSVADHAKLSWLVLRGGLRRFAGWLSGHPVLRLQLIPLRTERLLIAPQELRTADGTRASEIYSGRFAFAGKVVICDGRSPFEMEPPSEEWAESLFGFGWLRHLRAAESGITRANARALVDEWITLQAFGDAIAWRTDVVSRRIISWLSQAPLVLHEVDTKFYRRFLRNLTRQVRYLRGTLGSARDGLPRLQGIIALTYASLCMKGQMRNAKSATRRLVHELERQILPDGGHISRNPGVLIELLLDLLPLRQAYASNNIPPPSGLLNAIDRMMPMLRFFRHGDGNFALFNGMGPTSADLLAAVLYYDDARGTPVANAPHSGYQRLQAETTVMLADTGTPPPIGVSQEAHAGCLSFELSSKQHRIVVNCGMPATNRASWRHVARGTAAHSTVTVNEAGSCRFLAARLLRRLLGTPIISGPSEVPVAREERADGVVLRASHDGYADTFGILHQRTWRLSPDGRSLDGEDVFAPASGEKLPGGGRDEFAVRFHLHPAVKASRLTDGHGAMLMLPNREAWTLDAYEDPVTLEEGVFLAGSEGPRRAVQLVIHGRARNVPRVRWTFTQVDPAAPAARRDAAREPELPLQ